MNVYPEAPPLRLITEEVEKKIFWEEAKEAEPLTQPKSYFDVLMEEVNNYDEQKVHKALN